MINAYSLYNELRHGHFSHKRWVRPRDVARYYGCPVSTAGNVLRRMARRGEVEREVDPLDDRKSRFRIPKEGAM